MWWTFKGTGTRPGRGDFCQLGFSRFHLWSVWGKIKRSIWSSKLCGHCLLLPGKSSSGDRILAADSQWNDTALQSVFFSGLNELLKDELVSRDDPKDFDTLVSLAIRIDNSLCEHWAGEEGSISCAYNPPSLFNAFCSNHRCLVGGEPTTHTYTSSTTRGANATGSSTFNPGGMAGIKYAWKKIIIKL